MIAAPIVIRNEPCPMSARHEPGAWHDEMTAVRIAGEPGHIVQGKPESLSTIRLFKRF